ncbi:MAG: DUF2058 family protein [Xanthomonadales bacterium]|nr:DUF2058 family protein [Xanthomonadales bacterium]
MGSLQDELRKSGLVSEKSRRDQKDRRRKGKRKGAKRGGRGDPGSDLAAAYAAREQAEAAERMRKKEEEARRRKINARLAELIKRVQRVPDDSADVARYFEHHGRIRKLYVSAEQQQQLNAGEAAIVHVRGRYHVVAGGILEEIARLKPEAIAWHLGDADPSDDAPDEDFGEPSQGPTA